MGTDSGRALRLSLFLLSAASLAFEINLTRLFSVAQFYHFAFMIVSIALLGIGASGTALSIFPTLQRGRPNQRLSQFAFATGLSMLIGFLVTNLVPFDSFSIAWDPRQAWILILHYIVLAAPFFFSGIAVGYLLSAFPYNAGGIYSANLLGSAAGCVLALACPALLGAEGTVMLGVALACLAAMVVLWASHPSHKAVLLAALALLIFALADLGLRLAGRPSFAFLELRLSPYKSLSYALQAPGSRVTHRAWNGSSRVDVVQSSAIHSLPGLSYRYLQPLPPLDGLLLDGDDLSPILQPTAPGEGFADYLPSALAFRLRPQANALILEPRGGLDLFAAEQLGAGQITAVEVNPLVVSTAPIYADARLRLLVESDRSYLRRTGPDFDVIVLSLASSFHPVRSGAYTLIEDYRYTVEAFQDALMRLDEGGLLIATRWLQDPPSEDLRLFALALTALQRAGEDPRSQMVAFRGFNTATVVLKHGEFTPGELGSIRAFLAERAFDLTYAPDVRSTETNRYNILAEPKYYETYLRLLNARPREAFYRAYAYNVRPPTDDQPFFEHYFEWRHAPQVLAEFGQTWQPFGGAGYFVILALLAVTVVLAGALILLPIAFVKRAGAGPPFAFRVPHLLYFGLLGAAFLFVELPLMQRFILYLGQPAYAVALVIFSVLLFSGLGSAWCNRIPLGTALAVLAILLLAVPAGLQLLFARTLGLPLALRFFLTVLTLAPLGFLMGVPFPAGIGRVEPGERAASHDDPRAVSIPWIWAVNGASSVVSSILAALLALTFGFSWVLRLGALCYAGAWLTAGMLVRPSALRSRNR
jgi:hypothetical protein